MMASWHGNDQAVEQTTELPVIWVTITPMGRHEVGLLLSYASIRPETRGAVGKKINIPGVSLISEVSQITNGLRYV